MHLTDATVCYLRMKKLYLHYIKKITFKNITDQSIIAYNCIFLFIDTLHIYKQFILFISR